MKKKYIKKSLIFSFILILVTISMSIGFAAYNINVSITGDVHYDPPEAIYVSNVTVNSGTTSMTPTHTINTVTVGNIFTGTNVYKYNVTFRNHTSTEKKVSAVSGTNSSCTYSLDILNKNIKVDEYKTGVLTLTCGNSSINSTITFTFADYTIHKLINNSTSATNFLGVSGIANTKVRSLKFGDYETLIDDDDFMETYTRSYNVETSNNAGNGIVAFTTVPDENGMVDVTVGSVDGLVYTGESTNFHGLTNLTSIDFTNLDTKYLTSMNYFLYNAQNLTTLDISGLNTSSVTKMYRGFKNLNRVTSINVNGIDVSKVKDLGEAFMNLAQSTTKMSTFTISNWDALKATTMLSMFNNANVDVFDVTINTPAVENMQKLFYNSKASTFYTNFDYSSVTDMSYMFYGCTGVTDFFNTNGGYYKNNYDMTKTNFFTSGKPNATNLSYMFANCSNMTRFYDDYLGGTTRYSSVTNVSHMFENDISLFDYWFVTGSSFRVVQDASYMFYNCQKIFDSDVGVGFLQYNFTTSQFVNAEYMFAETGSSYSSSYPLYLGGDWSEVTNTNHMFYNSEVKKVIFIDVATITPFNPIKVTSSNYMFNGSSIIGANGTDCSGSNIPIGSENQYLYRDSNDHSGCFWKSFYD